jgi:PQQ-like domain
MRAWALAALALVSACSRSPRRTDARVVRPSATPEVVAADSGRRVFVHGKLLDLDSHSVIAVVGGAFAGSDQDERDAFVSDIGDLRAIEFATGKDSWRDKARYCGEIRVAGDNVYCLAGDGLTAIDRATGATRWAAANVTELDLEFHRLLLLPRIVVLVANQGQEVGAFGAADGKPLTPQTPLTLPTASPHGDIALNRVGDGFCAWAGVDHADQVVATCCDGDARSCQPITIDLLQTQHDGRWSFIDGGDRFALNGDDEAVIVELPSGKQRRVVGAIRQPARRRDGSPAGFLISGAAALVYQDLQDNTVPLSPLLDGLTPVWVDSERLIAGSFNFMTTGAALSSFDVHTGAPIWTADVQDWPVAHSKYFNDIKVELRGSHVLLWGHESSNDYLQVFDLATGKREFVDRVD